MEQTATRVWTLARAPDGSVAKYIDAFAQWLSARGYKRRCIGLQLQFVVRFCRWLKGNHIRIDDLTVDHADRFVARCGVARQLPRGFGATIHRFMDFLHEREVVALRPRTVSEPTHVQRIVNAYRDHLRIKQGLSAATCVQYTPFAEQFLVGKFGTTAPDLTILRAVDVIGFIQQQAEHRSPARARCATIALRSFLRYLRYLGEITTDLASAVPAVPHWSMTGIPRAMAADHVQAVLAACPRGTAVGRRDYAILMLLARLGLRSGEIVSLTLDGIDWEHSSLTVRGKSGDRSTLPMPADVGEAIAEYLRHSRPRCGSRAVFLCANAPIRGLGSTTIGSMVRAAIERAGIETPHWGSHQFRHALACEMLRRGATLTEIGSVLRHRHTKTTGIYAKVDFAALRPLALPWPGDAR
ncbi:site-specific integrase [Burkholderia ubonensis]|uniref:site-specific integrase n=1 Tax=Burkholderia ubonensis TaxID=101571 RepID=UPI000AAAD058|nr:site-specific integrase [Burkholderia ubonensis]